MKRQLFVLLLVLALALVACQPAASPAASTAPAASAGGEVATAGADGEKITIRLWGHQNNSFNQAHRDIIEKFMQENPNVEVKFETFPWDVFIQTIQTSLPAGQVADLIEMPGGMGFRYAKGGQLLEVPAEVMPLEQAQETYFAAPLGGYVYEGKLYGLPIEFNLEYGGAYVNEEMFKAAGLSYPPQWQTWDDVLADAQKLTKISGGAMEVAGLHYTNNDQLYTYFLSGILEQGGNYFAEDGRHFNFNTPEAIAVIQKMVDMAQKDKIVDPVTYNAESNWVGASFAQKLSAIAILGSWFAGEARITYPDLKFDYVKLPPFMGEQYNFASISGWGIVVTKYTQHPEIAWKLAAALAADSENALHFNLTTGTTPAMKSVAADERLYEQYPFMRDLVTILPYGIFQGDIVDPSQLEFDIVYPNLLQAIQGIITPEEAAQNIHEEANAMVDSAQP